MTNNGIILYLQRANVLTGSSKVKIGVLRNSFEEISCWTRPTDCCPTTNSRYSVRYIPLYVTYSVFVTI